MLERQQRNILQTAKVLDLVMQSVGPYNVIASIDEMREEAEEICPQKISVTSRLHESTETCCTYCEDDELWANDWRAERNDSTVISDCSTMESDEDIRDISVLVLEAAAACGPGTGSMVAGEQPEQAQTRQCSRRG